MGDSMTPIMVSDNIALQAIKLVLGVYPTPLPRRFSTENTPCGKYAPGKYLPAKNTPPEYIPPPVENKAFQI
jgi:hypothetical protein